MTLSPSLPGRGNNGFVGGNGSRSRTPNGANLIACQPLPLSDLDIEVSVNVFPSLKGGDFYR